MRERERERESKRKAPPGSKRWLHAQSIKFDIGVFVRAAEGPGLKSWLDPELFFFLSPLTSLLSHLLIDDLSPR